MMFSTNIIEEVPSSFALYQNVWARSVWDLTGAKCLCPFSNLIATVAAVHHRSVLLEKLNTLFRTLFIPGKDLKVDELPSNGHRSFSMYVWMMIKLKGTRRLKKSQISIIFK